MAILLLALIACIWFLPVAVLFYFTPQNAVFYITLSLSLFSIIQTALLARLLITESRYKKLRIDIENTGNAKTDRDRALLENIIAGTERWRTEFMRVGLFVGIFILLEVIVICTFSSHLSKNYISVSIVQMFQTLAAIAFIWDADLKRIENSHHIRILLQERSQSQ